MLTTLVLTCGLRLALLLPLLDVLGEEEGQLLVLLVADGLLTLLCLNISVVDLDPGVTSALHVWFKFGPAKKL